MYFSVNNCGKPNIIKISFFNNSEHQKNREVYLETRCEDLKNKNHDLVEYIAQFPKILEVSVTCIVAKCIFQTYKQYVSTI